MRGSVVSLGCQHKIYLFNKAININSDVFYSWVTQVLMPVLPKNSVIGACTRDCVIAWF
ncbi:hypothetical protein [Symbiopectobacterium sp. RP]|uniref:hypothetical protein n=1 Tax=Symbiopectobacterium sp. RP TaxID=3248553 RepID=UPI003D28EF8D